MKQKIQPSLDFLFVVVAFGSAFGVSLNKYRAFASREVLLFGLFLLALVVMPFDGEEHARAEHDDLEGNEDYGDPFHGFGISGRVLEGIDLEGHLLDATQTGMLGF